MKKAQAEKSKFGGIISSFFGSLLSSVQNHFTAGAENIMDHVEARVIALQKKLLRNLFIAFCIAAGALALVLSLCFYLLDTLHWQRAEIFLVIGITLIILASVSANLWKNK